MRCSILLLVGICATSAQAQTLSPNQRPKLPDGYARYVVPSQCLAAVARETQDLWRGSTFRDTLAYAVAARRDLIPPFAAHAAQACLTRLRATSFRGEQHITMLQLGLLASSRDVTKRFQDSVQVRLATEHRETKPWLVGRLAQAYKDPRVIESQLEGAMIASEPLRYPESFHHLQSAIPCDDGISCRTRAIIQTASRRDARARGDFAAAAALSDSILSTQRRSNRLPDAPRDETGQLADAPRRDFFLGLVSWYDDTMLAMHPASAQSVWERVRNGLKEIDEKPESLSSRAFDGQDNRCYSRMDSLFRLGATIKFPVLTPRAWVGRAGVVPAPAPGRVRLIVENAGNLFFGRGPGSFPEVTAMARRLYDKYAAAGFEVVWAMNSQGHFRGSSVLAFDEERQAIAAYWFDYNKVPGVIALYETTFAKRADGKRSPQSAGVDGILAQAQACLGNGDGNARSLYLADRDGNVIARAVGFNAQRDTEATLVRLIERALAGVTAVVRTSDPR